MTELWIDGNRIADDEPCYIVAEIGNNHGGNVQTAMQMVRMAQQCGASAVKFQMRDNQSLYSAALRSQPYEHEHSFGPTYGAHRAALELSLIDLARCASTAKTEGISCFATAFDEVSADRLMAIGMPAIKLASGSLLDTPLQKYVRALNVPIILSTGGGTEADIDRAVQTLTAGTDRVGVLHCTAAYPVRDFSELNLRCISTLRVRYPSLVVGWSGHDSGIAMAMVAYAFGARIIEKHFTLNRSSKGTDHAFSLEPVGLRKLVRDLERARDASGSGIKQIYDSERGPIAKMRRTWINGRWQIGTSTERNAAHEVH